MKLLSILLIAIITSATTVALAFDPNQLVGSYKGEYNKGFSKKSFRLELAADKLLTFKSSKTGRCNSKGKPVKVLLDDNPILVQFEKAISIYGNMNCKEVGDVQFFLEIEAEPNLSGGSIEGALLIQDLDFDEVIEEEIELRKK